MSVSASRTAKIILATDSSRVGPGLNDAKRQLRMFERDQIRSAKEVARETARAEKQAAKQRAAAHGERVGLVRSIASGAAAVAGFDLGGGLVGAATGVIDFERNLTRFQLASRKSSAAMAEMRASIAAVSSETALSRDNVLAGAQAFVDLAGAENYSDATMKAIARTAQATGSDINDIATAAYTMTNSMHVSGSELESVFSGMMNLTKDGTAHFKQMAPELIALMPQFARFGVTGREGAIQLTSMFQVIRGGFKDSAETATAMSAIFRGLILHAKRFAAAGVEVFNVGKDGTKTLKPIADIFHQIDNSKLIKDPTLLTQAFGKGNGYLGYAQLHDQLALYDKLQEEGKNTTAVAEDLSTYLTSPAGTIEAAWNKVKLAIAEAFTPERIRGFADAVAALADKIGPVVDMVSKIGGVLSFFSGVGKSIRGAFGGPAQYDDQDKLVASSATRHLWLQRARAEGMSEDEIKNRTAAAERNMRGVDRYNEASARITGAETDEKVTPASIRMAYAAKYAGDSSNSVDRNEQRAGAKYLHEAGFRDPADIGRDLQQQSIRILQEISRKLELGTKVEVKMDGNAIARAYGNARIHSVRPGGGR